MERLLAVAGASQEFCEQTLSNLRKPGGCFHPGTSSPRSSLVFLFGVGLCNSWDHLTPAGLAVELYLTACDLLDSIEDEEATGFPQAQSLNQATALLLLGTISLGKLTERNDPTKARLAAEALEIAALQSCQGQALDLAFESREIVTEQEYFQMARWKAAAPLSCASAVGALLSTDDEKKIEAAARYGEWLGMARQVRNDALAIAPGESKSDIRRRKRTLPVVYALGAAQGGDGEFLHSVYAGNEAPSPEEEARIRQLIIGAGGVFYAMTVAEIYLQRAREQVPLTGVIPDVAERLIAIARF